MSIFFLSDCYMIRFLNMFWRLFNNSTLFGHLDQHIQLEVWVLLHKLTKHKFLMQISRCFYNQACAKLFIHDNIWRSKIVIDHFRSQCADRCEEIKNYHVKKATGHIMKSRNTKVTVSKWKCINQISNKISFYICSCHASLCNENPLIVRFFKYHLHVI